MRIPQPPTPELVQSYVYKFDAQEALPETALAKLFAAFPNNRSADDVLVKAAALNSLYGTNIFAIQAVATHIAELNIDARLKQGDLDLVPDIATVKIKGRVRCNYSFATKYCAWHSSTIYPIYDNSVDAMLWAFQNKDAFSTFDRYNLRDYRTYVKVVLAFREHYCLQQFSLKQIDQYLWLYYKELAPPG